MGSTDNTAAANVAKNLQSKSSATATPPASGLSAPVGIGAENRPDDVFKVSSALAANGLMAAPQSHADSRLYSSIIGAQERMDSSLKRDGLIKPGGPTEGTFSRLAGQGFVKPAEAMPTTPQPVPAPSTGNAAINAQLTAQSKQAAVADAQAKAMQTAGDVTRTGFQQMQDVKRVQNARDDAARAEARARNLEQQRRERSLHDQEQAMRKANAAAADQAAKAKQAVSSGLKNLVSQAGAALGQVLQSSPQPPALPDETISSNQRLAASMARRRGIGDLPRFTTDAINTDPAKAIPEIADLLRQVHASDPAQANDLFSQTMQGIAPEHGQALQRAMQSYGQSDSKKQDGVNADQISEADFMVSPVYPVSANFGVREPASVQVEQKTPPPDPGQDDPEEPTEPKDPKQSNEEFCRRLRIQLEVDGANLDAARKRFDEANDRYNSIEAKLSPELTARDEARKHALIDMVPLVKPIRRGLKLGHVEARDFIGPVMDGVEIVDHSLKLGPLQKEFADALAERNDRQQDVENARDQVEKTLDELEAKGCK